MYTISLLTKRPLLQKLKRHKHNGFKDQWITVNKWLIAKNVGLLIILGINKSQSWIDKQILAILLFSVFGLVFGFVSKRFKLFDI